MAKRKSLPLDEPFVSCHFFSGLMNPSCRAGVAYADVRADHAPMNGFIGSFPCMPDDAQVEVSCEKFRLSTPEEIAAEEFETREALRKINRGRSPCCNKPLEPVGCGWKVCSACKEKVLHECGRGHHYDGPIMDDGWDEVTIMREATLET